VSLSMMSAPKMKKEKESDSVNRSRKKSEEASPTSFLRKQSSSSSSSVKSQSATKDRKCSDSSEKRKKSVKKRSSPPSSPSRSFALSCDDADEDGEQEAPAFDLCCEEESFSALSVPSVPQVVLPQGPPPTELYMQQQFNGSFEISDTLAGLLKTSVANLRSGAATASAKMGSGVDENTARSVWASIYVIALLQKWWFAYESSWEMTADKAKQFCVSVLLKSLGDRAAARRMVDELIASV